MNKHYRVTMVEFRNGVEHRIEQECFAQDRGQVINWYGLNEPDIVSYRIEEVK